jgi:putative peptidoglycan lipid II flippase
VPRLTLVAARQTPRRVAQSTVIVMGATLASTVLGFLREVVNARYFGASGHMDAFLAAAVVPTILFGVFNGALVSALVPIFSDYLATDREDDAWRLASTLIITLAIGLSIAAAFGALLAPWYIPGIARFHDGRVDEAITMARWLMPTIVATSLAGIVASLLNAYHRFTAAALQGLIANVFTVGVVIVAFRKFGIGALVLGTVAGVFAQLLIQLPPFIALHRFRFAVDFKHAGIRRLLVVLGPIAIGSAAGQIALFFDRYFASSLNEGSIAGMNYAIKLVGFPQQIFVTAIATVIFPVFASQFAGKNRAAMRRSIATGIKMVVFLTLPSAIGLCMLAGPIVQTLFERGAFRPEDTVLCASLLPYAAVGLVALAANVIMTRCLFACGEVRAPIAASVATVVLNVLLSIVFLPHLAARGLLLANAISQTFEMVVLGVVAWRLLGGFDVRGIFASFGKVAACGVLMAFALAVVQVFRQPPEANFLSRGANLVEHLMFGLFVFFAAARIVDSSELSLAIDLLLRRRPATEIVPLS